MSSTAARWNALIRTHHITSRKKVTKLKQAASSDAHGEINHVILRTGGSPGIMYVEGTASAVEAWVGVVQKLRYKDYQVVARPAIMSAAPAMAMSLGQSTAFHETQSVREFAQCMRDRNVYAWWRTAMGYAAASGSL